MEAEVHPETPISPVQVDQPSMVSTVIPPVPPIEAQTPVSPIAPTLEYAGFWVRYAAFFIDGIIVGLISLLIAVLSVTIAVIPEIFLGINGGSYQSGYWVGQITGRIISLLVGWAYYIYMTNKFGATYGKRALGLEVQSEDGGKLSLGKIAFRETIGKAISAVIFFIGYIMAAFTKRKQALHDKLADSVVIYKDPTKKHNGIVLAVAIFVSFLVLIAIIGILASVVLASLNQARIKGQEAQSQYASSTLMTDDQQVAITGITTLGHALAYYPTHKSFTGFVDGTSTPIAACSGKPIVNISPDGQAIASFGKLCSTPKQYFCVSVDVAHQSVDKGTVVADSYALGGHTVCQ